MARCIEGKWFGTVGRYKVTEDVDSYETLLDLIYTKPVEWEDLAKLSAAQADYIEQLTASINKSIEALEHFTKINEK